MPQQPAPPSTRWAMRLFVGGVILRFLTHWLVFAWVPSDV